MNRRKRITRLALDLPSKDAALSLAQKVAQACGCVVAVFDGSATSFGSVRAEQSAHRIEKLTRAKLQEMVDEVDTEIENATRH